MENRKKIKEYIGSHFNFLEKYLNGGYEDYVKQNLNKITHRKIYGVERIRKEYKHITSPYILEQRVLEDCKQTLNYIKNN